MQSPQWYMNRLRAMSLAEIGYRLQRAVHARFEQLGMLGAWKPPPANFDNLGEPASYIHVPELDVEPYLSAADRLLEGQRVVFSVTDIVDGDDFQWNRDPLTGKAVPLEFGKLIDYRDVRLVGDIKYLWEPSRQLELVSLAQAYALTGSRQYLDAIPHRVGSWLDECPYPYGVHWCSSLELGVRLINWSITWNLIGGAGASVFQGADGRIFLRRWLDSIYQHVYFIHHYYSRYSSANNHLIGEAAGVFIAACTWPCWDELIAWGDKARATLTAAVGKQTHADGVNREQAVAYQQFVLDFLILSFLAGRARKIEFPKSYLDTAEKMIDFIGSLMDAGGHVPMIGDADDGYVVALSQEDGFCGYRSLLNTGAILFDRPDLLGPAARLDDKTRFLLGVAEHPVQSTQTEARIPVRKQAFPEGGYFILGKDLGTNREIRVIADAGPLGYLRIAAHGHADALAFVLSVGGREILVDPGTYSYHTRPVWRSYFRGTSAHNTVRIDQEDQSVQGGNFMWLRHAVARCVEFQADSAGGRFVGEHDGYRRLSDPVTHRREIAQSNNIIRVTDRLACDGRHLAEQFWHFSEECRVRLDGSTVVVRNGHVTVTIEAPEDIQDIVSLRASDDPPGGWISRHFDSKMPTDSICFVTEIDGTTELETLISCDIRATDGDP